MLTVAVARHVDDDGAEGRLDRPLVRAVPRVAEVFPGGIVPVVPEDHLYLRPQQRFDRLLRRDGRGLPHCRLEGAASIYRFLQYSVKICHAGLLSIFCKTNLTGTLPFFVGGRPAPRGLRGE